MLYDYDCAVIILQLHSQLLRWGLLFLVGGEEKMCDFLGCDLFFCFFLGGGCFFKIISIKHH